jgi:cytosine/adenosine deaminase-related metal-dependent hydrolase
MKILYSDYILTMDGGFGIIRNGAVVFDKTVIEVGNDRDALRVKYPRAEVAVSPPHSVVMPGLINAHLHLEFAKNRTTLEYGDFLPWLYSVMAKREELIEGCDDLCVRESIDDLLDFGVTAFGAISSYGFDINACAAAPQKVVFFNEVIGSNPGAVDGFFLDFQARVNSAKALASDTFFPAVAVHSPYSVHPVLARRALDIARHETMRVSAHFMESRAEREWLDSSSGEFKPFFREFLKTEKAVTDGLSFVAMFEGLKPLYVHGVYTSDAELEQIEAQGASIVHCPVSNRLLGSEKLDLERLKVLEIPFLIATDGLSSNFSMNMFKEMRASLMQQSGLDLQLLARDLLLAATANGAKALRLNCGIIEAGRDADMIVFALPNGVAEDKNLPLQIILHANLAEQVYIQGEKIR